MRSKSNGNKKGKKNNLVNIVSRLAEKRLNRNGETENEEVEALNNKENEADDSVVPAESSPPESKRKSKRKPEKTAKSISNKPKNEADEQTIIEEPDELSTEVHDEQTMDELDDPSIELLHKQSNELTPDGNLTIVQAVLSDDELDKSQALNEDEDHTKKQGKKKKKEKQKCQKTKNNLEEITDANLKVARCTACNKSISIKSGRLCRHPDLNTIMCKECYKFYSSGKFKKDEYGVEEFCRWCADGGELICCDFCEKAFCKKCIKRNLGKAKLKELLEADENEKWSCFCCDPVPISTLIKTCNRIMRMLDEEKDQHTPYKDKKGREIIHGPNRGERRSLLARESSQQTVKSERITKKTYSKVFENGISSSAVSKDGNEKKCNGNGKEEVVVKKEAGEQPFVTTIESSDDDVEKLKERSKISNSKKKIKGGKAQKESSSSDDDIPLGKKVEEVETESSSAEELTRSKRQLSRKGKGKPKSERKTNENDSADDIVQSRIKRKGKNKKNVVSSDEEYDEESDDDEQTRSSEQDSSETSENSEASVKKERKNKTRRMSETSDSDSKNDSDVEVPKKKRKKKLNTTRKKGKWNFRRKRGESSVSDSDDEKGNAKKKSKSKKKVDKKKKGKAKRKRKVDYDEEDESDDENASPSKKGRKKIRKILDNEKLAEATRHARQLEEERRQRLLEKTKNTEFDKPDAVDVKEVVLEYKPDGKTPLVKVNEDLVKHLKPHQVEGVKFMYDCTIESVERWSKKEEGGGCILAHVMGLGKTLQIVTLVHTLYQSDLIELRRVLVVCPLNTVLNWQTEFDKWINVDDRLDVYVMNEVRPNNWHRADIMKKWMDYGGVLIMGYAMYRNLSQCVRVRSKHQKKIFKECLVDPGPELVVCDEGHVLRNSKSAISVAMNGIKTKRRIVLTGTPLQNNLVEYHCMVSFVKPSLLGTLKEFSNSFIRPIENGQCADSTVMDVNLMKKRCHVLHKMLQGCVQRKDYAEIARFLPPKFEYVIKIRLTAKQREMYKYYLDTFLNINDENKGKGGTLFSDYQALMRIWTHPWSLKLETAKQIENFVDTDDSLKDFVVESDEEDESAESSEEMSWTSDASDIDKGKRGGERSKSCSEESEENSGEEEVIRPSNKRRSETESDKNEIAKNVKADPDGPSTSAASAVVDDDNDIMKVKPVVNGKAVGEKEKNGVKGNNAAGGEKNGERRRHVGGEEVDGGIWATSTLRSGEEFKEGMVIEEEEEWYDKFLTEDDETNVELGSKVVLLLEILADAAALEEKVLVFSHSLISLDVIEMALGGGEIGGNAEDWCRGCDYFRMDGHTSAQMRKRWADIFNDEENKAARLFLISTKAGGLGINLVGASRVIVFDISWNPSHDVQSIFRAYRFGQNKPVFVYRFIAEGSMEEKIYDRQVTKLSMSQRVVDEQQIRRHFNANDLSELYRFEPDVLENENEERPTPAVPKDAVLADVLKRLYPKWIVKYHEHDSLLQNRPEEELTEAERKEAWEHWELEKQGALNPPQVRADQTQGMLNGIAFPNGTLIDAAGPTPYVQYNPAGPRMPIPAPQNPTTFQLGAQRPPNYQQLILDEQRRRLFQMEQRKLEETQRRKQLEEVQQRAQMLRIQQEERHRQQQEHQKRLAEVRQKIQQEQQRRQAEQQRLQEEQRRQQQRIQAEQQRQRAEQQRQQAEQRQREQQRLREQQQQQQMGQDFLQQLLRNRNARVTQQSRPGHPSQSVFEVVLDNVDNNPARAQQQRSPARIIELPPDE